MAPRFVSWQIGPGVLGSLAIVLGETLAGETRIQLCGRLVAEVAGRQVQDALPGRQGRALFGYLVAHRHRAVTRDALVDALWPTRTPPSADSALSALLSGLRRALGDHALAGREQLRLLLPGDAWVDIEAAEDAIHRAQSAVAQGDSARAWGPSLAALFIARRGFMPGVDAPWADRLRRRVEDIHLSALECYSTAALGIGGGELPLAERAARELVAAAPYRESGYLLLMRALAAGGNVAEALRVYETVRGLLRDELGAAPGPALRAFQTELLRSDESARAGGA
jgi:DNA-binding SARP family transcriptional activator